MYFAILMLITMKNSKISSNWNYGIRRRNRGEPGVGERGRTLRYIGTARVFRPHLQRSKQWHCKTYDVTGESLDYICRYIFG